MANRAGRSSLSTYKLVQNVSIHTALYREMWLPQNIYACIIGAILP